MNCGKLGPGRFSSHICILYHVVSLVGLPLYTGSESEHGLANRFRTIAYTENIEVVVTGFGAIFCLSSLSFKIRIHGIW